MKRKNQPNRKSQLHILYSAALFSALFCTDPSPAYSQNLADGNFTRGIGVYPGNVNEDFSPVMRKDESNVYRNIALNRRTFSSSSYDYNLSSQLLTDGIITKQAPKYLNLSSPKGAYAKREREWMIDEGPYSKNTIIGDDTFVTFEFSNYSITADKVDIVGTVVYDRKLTNGDYTIECLGSNDGKNWTGVGMTEGNVLKSGKPAKVVEVTDPNKQTAVIKMPTYELDTKINFNKGATYSYYKLAFKMKGAYEWLIYAANFFNSNKIVEVKPSHRFNSTWMSEGTEKEWAYIDFGTMSDFDKVIINWINKASEGKIQVSDDARNWKDVASISPNNVSKETISFKSQKARYLRVLMNKSNNGKPYIISEIEVMGKGGMVPVAKPMPAVKDNILTLSGGDWKVQRESEVALSGEKLSTGKFSDNNWLTATVPGTVLTSYVNAGALADQIHADNQLQASESFFNSNFWYRTSFDVPASFNGKRVFLNFDGINWKANIFINGHKLGKIEGAFHRGIYDVTDYLVADKNFVAVEIVKNEHLGAIKEKNEQFPDINGGILGADNPTFHATIGWDWIPTVRGRDIGIWNDVFLSCSGDVTVSDPFVETVLPLPETNSAKLTPEVILKNYSSKPVTGTLYGNIGDIKFSKEVTLAAGEEKAEKFTPEEFKQLNVQNPKLWWPNGYGEANLYDCNFSFKVGDKVSDATDFKTGIRQMTFNEDGGVLRMFVNGRRFIGRGGNWGFSEVNLNYRGREYDAAVKYHKDMNFTMIRDWVGMTGDKEFYEACDKYGIMVWQDFWLANPADGPDPAYPEMFVDNAKDYIKRIRQHSSLALYCGRNEGFPTDYIDGSLRKLLKEYQPDLHYISSSADGVVSGHGPYRMLPAKEYFTLKTGNDRFHSERGMPNVLTYESMKRTYSEEGIWPQSNEWGMHDYTREGAQGCTTFNEIIAKGYGTPNSAKEFADLAQWVNYNGHRSLFESRSKNRKGLLMWMSHSCWPSMVWQTYDYYFEPTAGYFGIKKASEPLHIQWNEATDTVEVVNYSAGTHNDIIAKAEIYTMQGKKVWEKEIKVNSDEDTTIKAFKLEYPSDITKVHFIKLRLIENGNTVSDNFYHRTLVENNYQDLRNLPKVKLGSKVDVSKDSEGNWKATVSIKNNSKTPALLIRVNLLGKSDGDQILPAIYSDNYFSMLPGETKEVTVSWKQEDTRGNAPDVKVTGFNVK